MPYCDDDESDYARATEMLWTLFNYTEADQKEAEREKERARRVTDGVASRALRFLFGTDPTQDSYSEDDEYRGKRPYHRHIQEPAAPNPIPPPPNDQAFTPPVVNPFLLDDRSDNDRSFRMLTALASAAAVLLITSAATGSVSRFKDYLFGD